MSYYQKNKWDKDWTCYWFYLQILGLTETLEDDKKVTHYPLASVMTEMDPYTSVIPPEEISEEHVACEKAFALVCRYSCDRNLIEEMVAANYWPLVKDRAGFKIESVGIPVFGGTEGVPFLRFGLSLPSGKTRDVFLADVE